MDVQNITGTDIVSNEISASTRISNENLKTEEDPPVEQTRSVDENKGKQVDTYA